MKRILASFLVLFMALSSLGSTVLADGAGTYEQGDLVWSEDFEGYEVSSDFSVSNNSPIALYTDQSGTGATDGTYHKIKVNSSYNKFLELNTKGAIYIPANAALDEGNIFTVDVDIKMQNSSTAGEYNVGMVTNYYNVFNRGRAYFTQLATGARNQMEWIKNGNGTSGTPESEFGKMNIPEETRGSGSGNPAYSFSDWNTYRFIVRKNESGVFYADAYVNGQYAALIGQREGSDSTTANFGGMFLYISNADETCKISVDNVKVYYGAKESDNYFTKGRFVSDNFDFDDLIANKVYSQPNSNNTAAVDADGNTLANNKPLLSSSRTLGAISRNKAWITTHVAKPGMGGKAANDIYLSNTGRSSVYIHQETGRGNTSYVSTHSTNIGTYVPEGDSVEVSADIIFDSHNSVLNFEPLIKVGGMNGVRISPYWYSIGHWQDPDWNSNASQGFSPGLPINKWVNIKIVITRGTSTTCNKLSIYADNRPVCENVELNQWFASSSFTKDASGKYSLKQDATPLTGNSFKGFEGIRLSGAASKFIDNVKITRYFGGSWVAPKAPAVFKKAPRGVIYAGSKSIGEIVTEYGLQSGSYVIRDNNGNDITNTTIPAAGKFIAVEAADQEELYVAMTDDVTIFSASTNAEFISKFAEIASDGGGIATATEGLFGKGDNEAILLTAKECTVMQSDGITPKKNHFWNSTNFGANYSGKNTGFEFSVRTDGNSGFHAGYRIVSLTDETEGFGTISSDVASEYMTAFSIINGKILYSANNEASVIFDDYRANEWVHVKFLLDYEKDVMTLSINGGEPITVLDNASSTIKYINYFRLSLVNVGDIAVVDDVKAYTGSNVIRKAPAISYNDEISSKYFNKTISVTAYNAEEGYSLSDYNVNVAPVASIIQYIDADGMTVAGSTPVSDGAKVVAINDGIYAYYTYGVRKGITVTNSKTENGVEVIVDDNLSDKAVASGIKLIRAVYDSDDSLASTTIIDVPFEEDTFTSVVEIPNYTPAEGEYIKYFAWNMSDGKMTPISKVVQ